MLHNMLDIEVITWLLIGYVMLHNMLDISGNNLAIDRLSYVILDVRHMRL